MYLKRFVREVPELKDMNKLVDVMCTVIQNIGRTPLPAEKTQMYFNVATRIDKEYREANQGRGEMSSRNIHLAEILGEVSEENLPLENNVHEVLPDGDDDVDGEVRRCTRLLPLPPYSGD